MIKSDRICINYYLILYIYKNCIKRYFCQILNVNNGLILIFFVDN